MECIKSDTEKLEKFLVRGTSEVHVDLKAYLQQVENPTSTLHKFLSSTFVLEDKAANRGWNESQLYSSCRNLLILSSR